MKPPASFDFGEHSGIRLDHRAILQHGAIENHGIVPDHAIAAHRAGMHHRVGPHGHAVADDGWIQVLRDVDGARLADEEIAADADEMAVAPDRSTARYRGVRAHLDLAEHARAGPKKAHAFAEARLDAVEGQEKRCIGGGFG